MLSFPTISLTDDETVAAGVLGVLGAVWALKKAISFISGVGGERGVDPNEGVGGVDSGWHDGNYGEWGESEMGPGGSSEPYVWLGDENGDD
jgi:hypothetical protein